MCNSVLPAAPCIAWCPAGVFLLVSLVSLPESPRWLVMRGQLDAALATLHTIIASSSSSTGGTDGRSSRARSKARRRLEAVQVAAGLQPAHPAAAAEDAAWLNAAPEAGRPRNPEQQVGAVCPCVLRGSMLSQILIYGAHTVALPIQKHDVVTPCQCFGGHH